MPSEQTTATCPYSGAAEGASDPAAAGSRHADLAHYDYKTFPRIQKDLWNMAAEMADMPDIFWSEALGGYWVVASAAAFEEFTNNNDIFSTRVTSIPPLPTQPVLIPATLDPPVHTKWRKQMTERMFSVRALKGLDDAAAKLCGELVDEFIEDGECDFVEAFASRLPVDLFLDMMGAPPEDREVFLSWVGKIFHAKNPTELNEGRAEANAFVSNWIDSQLADPSNVGSFFQAMLDTRIDGEPMTRPEMHSMTLMLFLGGLDTVVSQLSHLFRFFAENPKDREFLTENPQRIPQATEELLRRFGITNFMRVVTRDCTFHGAELKEGQMILASTPFANLDRRAFPDPLTVNYDRAKRIRHYGFGDGVHICIGAHLARTLIREALQQLLPKLKDLRIAPGADLKVVSGGTFHLVDLPLQWTPPSAA